MKHHALQDIQTLANVNLGYPHRLPAMTRRERLERWADLLDHCGHQALSTLEETEFQPARERAVMRADNSPLSVAFADQLMHEAGLKDDSYGEAKRFFELSNNQMHRLLCHCHFGPTVNASTAAHNVRAIIAAGDRPGILTRLRNMLGDKIRLLNRRY